MNVPKPKSVLFLLGFVLFMGMAAFGFAEDENILVLDCTNSRVAWDLTNKFPVVYLTKKNFDPAKFSDSGELSKTDFDLFVKTQLKAVKDNIRFKLRKADEMEVYIVTSIPMKLQETINPAAPDIQWVSDPVTFTSSNVSRPAGPVTTSSQPLTLSLLKTARFLIQEQQRPTALESGTGAMPSYVYGVVFKESAPVSELATPTPSPTVYYYYRQRYKLKFESSVLKLSFEDQSGNQQNVATIISGASENFFLTAGGPLYAYDLNRNGSGVNPTGLYVGINWTPNDIYDPGPRYLIVNLLDFNTTNPALAIGLIGLGMGFPKMNGFIPLSTLSITETLAYNLNQSRFQLLTLVTYDVSDVLQLLKL
jgi:hypothetical protein